MGRFGFATLALLFLLHPARASDLLLRCDAPVAVQENAAHPFANAFPIGNGRLGALLTGGAAKDRIAFSENSLLTLTGPSSGGDPAAAVLPYLGTVTFAQPDHQLPVDYKAALDLGDGLFRVEYLAGGVHWKREYLASFPANVIAIRYSGDKNGSLNGTLSLDDARKGAVAASGNRITAAGKLPNGFAYEWQALVAKEGKEGTVAPGADGVSLEIRGCNAVTLILAAGSDYLMDPAAGFHTTPPHDRVTAAASRAGGRNWNDLRNQHLDDYRNLFNRVSLDLGASANAEALPFHYARYLLIASSRPGTDPKPTGLPPTLQGVWNDTLAPATETDAASGYRTDLGEAALRWPCETGNLSECRIPFLDLIRSQLPAWRQATSDADDWKLPSGEKPKGFAVRACHDLSGDAWGPWNPSGNAWLALQFWDHFTFTRDYDYLRNISYPVIKEACDFWEPRLSLPDPLPPGDAAAVRALLTASLDAGKALNVDPDYRKRIAPIRDKVPAPDAAAAGTDSDPAAQAFLRARAGDGAGARKAIQAALTQAQAQGAGPSLLGRALRIDGIEALGGAFPEMLVQSQNGEIALLPALPPEWKEGAVTGLRARGGFEVDVAWKDGKLVTATVRCVAAKPCALRYGNRSAVLFVQPYGGVTVGPDLAQKTN